MIDKTLKRVSSQLEAMIKNEIGVERALDLLEASTSNLEEIVAINIMRESLQEMDEIKDFEKAVPVGVFYDQFDALALNA